MRKKAILYFFKFASGFLHDAGIKMNDFESGRLWCEPHSGCWKYVSITVISKTMSEKEEQLVT